MWRERHSYSLYICFYILIIEKCVGNIYSIFSLDRFYPSVIMYLSHSVIKLVNEKINSNSLFLGEKLPPTDNFDRQFVITVE